jgi:Xaa-Pro aminopeptidase
LVRRELGQKYRSVVEYACDTIRTAQTGNYNPPYRKAFSALSHAFDTAVRTVRDGETA